MFCQLTRCPNRPAWPQQRGREVGIPAALQWLQPLKDYAGRHTSVRVLCEDGPPQVWTTRLPQRAGGASRHSHGTACAGYRCSHLFHLIDALAPSGQQLTPRVSSSSPACPQLARSCQQLVPTSSSCLGLPSVQHACSVLHPVRASQVQAYPAVQGGTG
eukprot:357299-Chlamydomonas_euryale.AAC.1